MCIRDSPMIEVKPDHTTPVNSAVEPDANKEKETTTVMREHVEISTSGTTRLKIDIEGGSSLVATNATDLQEEMKLDPPEADLIPRAVQSFDGFKFAIFDLPTNMTFEAKSTGISHIQLGSETPKSAEKQLEQAVSSSTLAQPLQTRPVEDLPRNFTQTLMSKEALLALDKEKKKRGRKPKDPSGLTKKEIRKRERQSGMVKVDGRKNNGRKKKENSASASSFGDANSLFDFRTPFAVGTEESNNKSGTASIENRKPEEIVKPIAEIKLDDCSALFMIVENHDQLFHAGEWVLVF
eukprot:TRINITY_DN5227_c0_g2_i4.p1 TRINITY_DN5227_c0_g2~~TRINITY_DN5227_c0_g2_i4.p1  ORF type:complete len:295 (+),score=42.51 TRINITY_DN5227_c0_g2_i4:62-946(+)